MVSISIEPTVEDPVFRMIARRQYRRAWQSMNAHDYQAIIRQLAPDFRVTFQGDTSLGGTRTTRAAMAAWFGRLFRLLPDARFELRQVAVDGPPWNTRIAGLFTIRATTPLGEPYENQFVQFVGLRFGRVSWYEVHEDSLRWWRLCQHLGSNGVEEAVAPPITDAAG
jgi:ketosteroid isomerase-like protein